MDEGDSLVRMVSERLNEGQDWRQLQMTKPAPKPPAPKAKPAPLPPARRSSKKKEQQQSMGFGNSKNKAVASSEANQLEGSTQKPCSWQAYVTQKMMNVAYPDLQAIYQVRCGAGTISVEKMAFGSTKPSALL